MTNPNLLWAQLTRTALLGTRQSTEPLPDLLAVSSVADANEREKQALLTAGALSLVRKAGFEPPLGAMSNIENAPAEFPTQSVIGVNGSAHLRLLLSGQHSSLLADYLRDMAQHARRVPYSLLVPLLEFARTRPDLHQVVGPVLGSRGTWVAQQNPEWQPLLAAVPTPPDDSVLETGTLHQRITYLENLRLREPQRGRE